MDITPHLGIGDLLIVKMIQLSNNLNISNINLNKNTLQYFGNCQTKLNSLNKFIYLLFPEVNIYITDGPCDYYDFCDKYKIYIYYLYDYIIDEKIIKKDITLDIKNKYNDYIVFHTKLRYDKLIDKFNNEILEDLIVFLKNFKTQKKILILGEKKIGDNYETRFHKTCSLYDHLLLLNDNNNMVDLTCDILTDGNDDNNKFLYDIEIINNAECNIVFGIGGPYTLCKAFSKKNIFFCPFVDISPCKDVINMYNNINNSTVQNTFELKNKLIDLQI